MRNVTTRFILFALLLCLGISAVPAFGAANFQDEFDAGQLGPGWLEWDGYANQNPTDIANHAVFQSTGSHLSISFPGGVEHNEFWFEQAQVTRAYEGSGVYETKMDTPINGSQQFGLIFQTDPNTFMIFMLYTEHGQEIFAYVERFVHTGGVQFKQTPVGVNLGLPVPGSGPYYVRVILNDNTDPTLRTWEFFYSVDGSIWNPIFAGGLEGGAPHHNIGAIQEVGLFAGNQPTGYDAFDARFDYFRSYPTLDDVPVTSPVSVIASPGDGRIDVWWSPLSLADDYSVYRSPTPGGPYTLITTTTQTVYTDATVTNGNTYYYRATARRQGEEGPPSAETAAVPHVLTGMETLPTAGLVLALDAGELAYLHGDGDPVHQWTNAQGPLIAAIGLPNYAPTYIASAINNKPVLRFDGVREYLSLTASGFEDFTGGMSLYVIAKPSSLSPSFKLFALGNGAGRENIGLGRASTTDGFEYFVDNSTGGSTSVLTSSGLTTGEAALFSVVQAGGVPDATTTVDIARNGTSVGAGTVYVPPVAPRSVNYIGKSFWPEGWFDGDIAEVLLYNRNLTVAERIAVHEYFTQKYGISVAPPPAVEPLGSPANPIASPGDSSVTVTWDAVSGVDGYRLYRSANPGSGYVQIADVTSSGFTDTAVTNGTSYYYVVTAYNPQQESAPSVEVSATPNTTQAPLPAPQNPLAAPHDESVHLAWGPVTGATGYRVYRSTIMGSGHVQVAEIVGTTYVDSGLINRTTYYYFVTAYGPGQESPGSIEVAATPVHLPAPSVSATRGNATVRLAWNTIPGAQGYRVYRSTSSGSDHVQIADVASTDYTDVGLENGTAYYYLVAAYDAVEESLPSLEVMAIPVDPNISLTVTSGLLLSLDARTAAAQYAQGDAVALWADTSGLGVSATGGVGTAPTLVNYAIGGRPVVRFDGVNDFMTLPAGGFNDFTAGLTIYIVARPTVLRSGYKMVALGNGPGSDNIYVGRSGASSDYQYVTNSSGGSFGWFATNSGLVAGEASLISVSQPGGAVDSFVTAEVAKNGTVIGSGSVYVPPDRTRGVNYIGKSFWNEGLFQGDIAEILVYDHELSTGERIGVNSYFSQKYGFTVASPPPPSAPANVTATPYDSSTMLSWDAVAGADSYGVYRSTTSGSGYVEVADIAETTVTDVGLVNGTMYYYVVTTRHPAGESVSSTEISVVPVAPPILPPANATATAGDASIELVWDAVPDVLGYRLYRSTTQGSGHVQIVDQPGTTYVDAPLNNGTRYYYVVSSYNAFEESAPSTEFAATPIDPSIALTVTDGLLLSLDAQTAAAQYAEGGAVVLWADTSGLGVNATGGVGTAPTLVNYAIGGRPVVRFDGVNDFMTLPAGGFNDFTAGLTIYIVARPTVLRSGYKMVALGNGPGSDNIYVGRSGASSDYQYVTNSSGGSFGWFATNSGLVAGEVSLISVSQPGGAVDSFVTAEVAKNGTVIGSGSVYVPPDRTRGVNYIGKSFWNEGLFQGDIAEILIYDHELSTGERVELHSYISQKYGFSVALPPPPPPPPPPANIAATPYDGSAMLTWDAVTGADSYGVYRSTTSGSGYVEVADIADTTVTNVGLVNGTTYYYVVTTRDPAGESVYSTQISVVPVAPPILPPANATATAGDASIELVWDAVPDVLGYRLYRSTTQGSGHVQIVDQPGTTYVDAPLNNGTRYYYVVSSYNAFEESVLSAEFAATPVDPSIALTVTNGLLLSLDAGTAAAQYAEGSAVVSWADTSGLGVNATGGAGTAPTLVNYAIGGRPVLRFDGVNDFMTLPAGGFNDFTAGLTIYIVARPTVLQSGYKMVALGNGPGSDNIYVGRNGTSSGYQYVTNSSGGSFGWFTTNSGLVAGEASLISVSQPGGAVDSFVTAEVAKNGAAIGSGSVYVPPIRTRGVNYIGKSFWSEGLFQGDIAEILIYDHELSIGERVELHSYASQKYGFTVAPPY